MDGRGREKNPFESENIELHLDCTNQKESMIEVENTRQISIDNEIDNNEKSEIGDNIKDNCSVQERSDDENSGSPDSGHFSLSPPEEFQIIIATQSNSEVSTEVEQEGKKEKEEDGSMSAVARKQLTFSADSSSQSDLKAIDDGKERKEKCFFEGATSDGSNRSEKLPSKVIVEGVSAFDINWPATDDQNILSNETTMCDVQIKTTASVNAADEGCGLIHDVNTTHQQDMNVIGQDTVKSTDFRVSESVDKHGGVSIGDRQLDDVISNELGDGSVDDDCGDETKAADALDRHNRIDPITHGLSTTDNNNGTCVNSCCVENNEHNNTLHNMEETDNDQIRNESISSCKKQKIDSNCSLTTNDDSHVDSGEKNFHSESCRPGSEQIDSDQKEHTSEEMHANEIGNYATNPNKSCVIPKVCGKTLIGSHDPALTNTDEESSMTDNGDNASTESECHVGGKSPPASPRKFYTPQKRKLKRTQYSKEDILRLNQHFQRNPWLSPEKQEHLATEMGYSETQIKTWFQNKRASIFGTRRPKKRPLQELSFNQPFCPNDISHQQVFPILGQSLQSQQPQQPNHSGLQRDRVITSHNRLREEAVDVDTVSTNSDKIKPSTHLYTSPIDNRLSNTINVQRRLSNNDIPPLISHPANKNIHRTQQTMPLLVKDGYLPRQKLNPDLKSQEPTYNTAVEEPPVSLQSRLQMFPHWPGTWGDVSTIPSRPTGVSLSNPPIPPVFTSSLTRYPVVPEPPYPSIGHPTMWSHPFYSHLNPGFNTHPFINTYHRYHGDGLPNSTAIETPYNRIPNITSIVSTPSPFHCMSQSRTHVSVTPPTFNEHVEQVVPNPLDTRSKSFYNNPIIPNQFLLTRGNLDQRLFPNDYSNVQPRVDQYSNVQQPLPFSSYLSQFTDRLHRTVKPEISVCRSPSLKETYDDEIKTNFCSRDRTSITCTPDDTCDEIQVD